MHKYFQNTALIVAVLSVAILGGCVNPAGTAPCVSSPTGTACPPVAPPPGLSAIVGMLQTNYPTLRALAEAYATSGLATTAEIATIRAAEAVADPLITGLTPTSSPQNMALVAQAAANILSTGIGAKINPQTKADVTLGLTLLTGYLQTLPKPG